MNGQAELMLPLLYPIRMTESRAAPIFDFMIVYNVTVKVDSDVQREWLQWMKEVHIPKVMNSGMFTEYRIFRLLEQDESDGITYAIQYLCKSMADYEKYRHKFAPELQKEHEEKYRDKFVAFRTVLELVG